jgi:hypothetical protein
MTMSKKKEKPIDPDLATWIRIGEGVPEDDDGLTEGERIVEQGNRIVRGWLAPTRWREGHRNPFVDPFI